MGYPCRKSKVRTRGVRGRFFSQKVGRFVNYESLNEKYLFKVLETSPYVESYCEQPLEIEYSFDGDLGKYTPDVLATHIDQSKWLYEAKPQEELDKKDPRLSAKLQSAAEFCDAHGWKFVVVTEAIRESNEYIRADTLWPHLMHPGLDRAILSDLLIRFEREGSILFSELCPRMNWHDEFYSYALHLIGLGKLCEYPYGIFGPNTLIRHFDEQ